MDQRQFFQFQPLKREAASLAQLVSVYFGDGVMVSTPQAGSGLFSLSLPVGYSPSRVYQPLKWEAASLAELFVPDGLNGSAVSTPQAGSGLFSLLCF